MKHMNFAGIVLACLLAAQGAHADDSEGGGGGSLAPKDLTNEQLDSCKSNLCLGENGKELVECETPLKQLNDLKKKKRPAYLAICPKQ